jgi:hypothetical protein
VVKLLNKIASIYWVDSSSYNLGWNDEKDLDLKPIFTVGFIINETDEAYYLSHTIGYEGVHFDLFCIPKGCVKDIAYLEAPNVSKEQIEGEQTRISCREDSGEIRLKG